MDFLRSSALVVTGHDDTFDWIELIARSPRAEDAATDTHRRAMLPCAQVVESAVLADGTRHATYFTLARYWAHLNMHYPEIVARLQAIDHRNPIRDCRDIEMAASTRLCHRVTRYCDTGVLKGAVNWQLWAIRQCNLKRCNQG